MAKPPLSIIIPANNIPTDIFQKGRLTKTEIETFFAACGLAGKVRIDAGPAWWGGATFDCADFVELCEEVLDPPRDFDPQERSLGPRNNYYGKSLWKTFPGITFLG